MKYLPSIITFLFPIICSAQKSNNILLKWKVDSNETLNYLMAVTQVTAEIDSASSLKQPKVSITTFYGPNTSYSGTDTMLFNLTSKKKNIVSIDLITIKQSIRPLGVDTTKGFMWQKTIPGDTIFRGSLDDKGSVHTFYSSDLNQMALYFQLPIKKIRIGDSWPVDFAGIYINGAFKCDSCFKLNSVTLTDIKKRNNETVAIINYNIREYVSATPIDSSEFEKFMMEFSYNGTGEFSIERGRWISYNGIQTSTSTGELGGKSTMYISLILQ
jgi:hypothetical protein